MSEDDYATDLGKEKRKSLFRSQFTSWLQQWAREAAVVPPGVDSLPRAEDNLDRILGPGSCLAPAVEDAWGVSQQLGLRLKKEDLL